MSQRAPFSASGTDREFKPVIKGKKRRKGEYLEGNQGREGRGVFLHKMFVPALYKYCLQSLLIDSLGGVSHLFPDFQLRSIDAEASS